MMIRKSRRALWRGLAVALVLASSGCFFSFKRPTLRVAEVRLASLGVSGGRVAVEVEITNPNGYDLQSAEFVYALAFSGGASEESDWVTLAEGRHEKMVTVPAGGTAITEIDVPFDLAAVTGALGRLLRRGELDYRFSGELQVTEPRRMRVPFTLRGVFRP